MEDKKCPNCQKTGWVEDQEGANGLWCMNCDHIWLETTEEDEVGPQNPLHAKNNPLPTNTPPQEPTRNDAIILDFAFGKFSYQDCQTGKKQAGEVKWSPNQLIEKARKNAKSQRCKLFVSEMGKIAFTEDYS